MPTGYTMIIEDKEQVSLEEFALRCAKAFGYFDKNDDSLDANMPDKFKPSDYHLKKLTKAKNRLDKVNNMTDAECLRSSKKKIANNIKSIEKYIEKNQNLILKYNAMLIKVSAWKPPTEKHKKLKEFMINQIDQSIPDIGYEMKQLNKANEEKPDMISWKRDEIERLQKDIEHHSLKWDREVMNAKNATIWVKQLRESLV